MNHDEPMGELEADAVLMVTQRTHRRVIEVGPEVGQVSPVRYWYDNGHFKNDDEARGAFFLAYQQGQDGMGTSVAAWMGLSDAEFDAWMRADLLPSRRKT